MRPTESAKQSFGGAEITSQMARTFVNETGNPNMMYETMIADSLQALAKGLGEMATGLRATYMLLEQIQQKVDRR